MLDALASKFDEN